MRIRVICEGKTKDTNLRALQADYGERITHFGELVVEEIDTSRHSRRASDSSSGRGGKQAGGESLNAVERHLLERMQGSYKVFLDGQGCEWTSEDFSEWLGQQALQGRRELAFLVGGTDGFSTAFRRQADLLLALSRMTLTRDWARTLLLEQIYRAFTILRGYPYPR